MTEPLGLGVEEPPDRHGAFPRLDDEQRARFREVGAVRAVTPGEVLFRAGDPGYDFFVVESGAVTIVQGLGREDHVVAVHGTHRFIGELNLLTGSPPYLSAVVRDAGEVIQVSVPALRAIVTDDEDLSNLILRAFLARRSILIDLGAGVQVVGSRFSRDSQRLREFLARNRMPYRWMDLEDDEEADTLLRALGVEPAETPVVIGGRGVMRNPSNGELAALLGLGARGAPPAMCDVVIVGGGPAGLAAAVYGASEGLDTQVDRRGRVRRAGRHVLADRELPRLPLRHQRRRAGRARRGAGAAVRCPHRGAGRGGRAGVQDGHHAIGSPAAESSTGARDRRHRRPVPHARRSAVRATSRAPASTTPPPKSRRAPCDGEPGRGDRRRELGRSGGAVPRPARQPGDRWSIRAPTSADGMSRLPRRSPPRRSRRSSRDGRRGHRARW